ncbi:MAG: ADOP family duplicated permease [Candidatus Sulfopaludibacter sp.]|nr:ADOP family duplicated permease [Candidatus Sulfopaludibacter sp.]
MFRNDRLSREIDEELRSHIEEGIARGRDPVEARRAFGSALRQREHSRDVRLVAWLDSLRADAVFGWRQLMKRKVTSAAAILSLGLAIGACTAAFRLIDALLLRPLPVAHADNLYAISFAGINPDGKARSYDSCSYPMFRQMRAAVRGKAELIAVSQTGRVDLTYGSDQEMEKAYWQSVSGWMFRALGLRPVLGRTLTENDDLTPGAQPYAVLSFDYWTRRFARDPGVIGRSFRKGDSLYTIAGVGPERFTGTEPGIVTDIFVPTMMNAGAIHSANSFWLRILVLPKPGVAVDPLRAQLHSVYWAFEHERAKGFVNYTRQDMATFPQDQLLLEPAAAGVSGMQKDYRRSLAALGVLVGLVLLIACANVANLMTAQAASRAREMALRVSIGAGRLRLVQLVLLESAWLALLSAAMGGVFAWWAAPFVVARINPEFNPARLVLPADWRVFGFGTALTAAVTLLFGLLPALRASAVKPALALKGGGQPHSGRRSMHVLIAVQMAFCVLVLFVAGLFAATFEGLSHQPAGFSAERLLALEVASQAGQPAVNWEQVAGHLRTVPGVEKVALAGWPLLSGTMSNNHVSVQGATPGSVLCFFLSVSPGWVDTMRIPFLNGRDFRPGDAYPGAAIVNRTFARQYFGGADPVGQSFETVGAKGERTRLEIVGLVADAQYRSLREPVLPVAYIPFRSAPEQSRRSATLMVRTASQDPRALISILRQEIPRARAGFRLSTAFTQESLVAAQTVRERLLAALALFFAGVALLLAGVGLYGVLDYAVLQRRREIGIRMALGARPGDIVRGVTAEVYWMVLAGAGGGIVLGMGSAKWVATLLFQVKPTDPAMLLLPLATILAVALVAALPAAMRAVRIDPATMLRSE